MKVELDNSVCLKCGSCAAICPKNFTQTETGDIEVVSQEVTPETKEAAACCPVSAITVTEEKTEEEK